MRTAVVDVGTNSTRLLVADVDPGGALREVARESLVTRLGDGLEAGGRLRPDARERVLGVVERYAAVIAQQGAERAVAVLTSAARDAADGPDFAAELTARTGIEGAILGGDEEAARSWLQSENTALGGRPVDLLQTLPGVIHVVGYLDARRAVV
jgi:exopolyphosphatase/guanosine-5'-triphosphate,3'-diphosphate pyrophosphatase